MAIGYTRTFEHNDWINNEDVVDAEGENGFNVRFHSLEDELDEIGRNIGEIGEQLESGLGIEPIVTLSHNLSSEEVTDPALVETYSDADFTEGVRKIYQVTIEPIGNFHGQVSHHFIHRPVAGGQTEVSVWFRNELTTATRFSARVFALNAPPASG